MADLLWEDIKEITPEEAEQDLLNQLDDADLSTSSWQPFSLAPLTVKLSADFRARSSKTAVLLKKSFMPTTATQTALTETSRSFYANSRNSPVEAQHLITLSCDASSGPHSIDLGELTFVDLDSGSTFRNVDGNSVVYPFTLNPGATQTFLIEAETAGTGGNTPTANSVQTVRIALQTTLAGVTITSHVLERSGLDEESDARLSERDQLKWSLLSRFALIDEAVQAEALRVAPAVLSVGVDSTNPRGQGTFDAYCAGLDATSSADDVSAVQSALDRLTMGRKNPMGKTVKVYPAPEVVLDISGDIYITGITAAKAQTAAETALIAFIRSVPPGGFDFTPGPSNVIAKNDIETEIRQAIMAAGATKCTVVLSTPTADVSVTAFGKAIRGSWSLAYNIVTG